MSASIRCALVCALTLAGVSAVDATPATSMQVLDTFRVGDSVYVRSLALEPGRNGLWVGTSTGVLDIDLASRTPRHVYTRKDGLANEYVFATFVDSEGYKWFGTNAGGVARLRDEAWKVYFPMHGLADYWGYAFAEQRGGILWIGTWAGANRVDLKTMQFTTYRNELVNEWVYAIAIDDAQRVWFGTEGGISRYDGKAWKHWTHADGLGAPNTRNLPASRNTGLGTRTRHDLNTALAGDETYNPGYVFALAIDAAGQVWAGTWGGGVARYDGRTWTNLTTADGLAGNIVYSIARAADGTLWFGTNHGASRYDGKQWQTFDRTSGLADDNVYAIACAPGGEVWLGTKAGVSRLGSTK